MITPRPRQSPSTSHQRTNRGPAESSTLPCEDSLYDQLWPDGCHDLSRDVKKMRDFALICGAPDHQTAGDIVADWISSTLEKRAMEEPIRKRDGFLFVCVMRAIGRWRNSRTRTMRLENADRQPAACDYSEDRWRQANALIDHAITHLTRVEREVVLFLIKGKSRAEIAQLTGSGLSTVYDREDRAYQKMLRIVAAST